MFLIFRGPSLLTPLREDLYKKMIRILEHHPNCTQELVKWRQCIQQPMRCVGPDEQPHQKSYKPATSSSWHINSNYKLIRWRILVHSGIDSSSKVILYMNAVADNRATVLKTFLKAVEVHGMPSHVMSDKATHYMLTKIGLNCSSCSHGRIFTRDVYEEVLDLFYTIFTNLESEGFLNPDNEVHLYALHRCFLPRIQKHLDLFQRGWNHHHRQFSVKKRSPFQLWLYHEHEAEKDELQVDMEHDVHRTRPCGDGQPEVHLKRSLTEEEKRSLPEPNGPLSDVTDVYIQTVKLLSKRLPVDSFTCTAFIRRPYPE
ncbi:hypothetical protein NFI96_030014 [Prochilodus magdalenae]|nr:hypothetical protein NFI96_030014 [Prochilodus magdalenae]